MKLFKKLGLSPRFSMVALAFAAAYTASAQTEAERLKIVNSYDQAASEAFQQNMQAKYARKRAEMQRYAQQHNLPFTKQRPDGTFAELQRIAEDGTPIYYATSNLGCAKTTRAIDLNTGGSLGLTVNGQNMTVAIWDGGPLRLTHTAFGSRATQADGVTFTTSDGNNGHANHVAGTMVAALSASSGTARGMAYEALIKGYDWNNDVTEATSAAANGLLLSNHSYGYGVTDANCVMQMPVHWVGKYDETAADWDAIMAQYPYYQQVNAAGNDRECQASITNKGGFDLLTGHSCAKNAIVVAAVNEVASYTSASSVVMSTFSNWGPTDDGRIKPDISAKGVNVKSVYSTSNTAYSTLSGTSMASPNTTGTLLLIQQHYKNVTGSFMYASMLRGLVIHTADEAGAALGPDYKFGWGLLNAKKAAQTISAAQGTAPTAILSSQVLSNGSSYTITVSAPGAQNLEATICWTDPAGAPITTSTVDPTTKALRNDLDIRITRSTTTYSPWILDPANPNTAATKGDNTRDNVEKVYVSSATAGVYTITVTHKGTLVGNSQRFALVVTGIAPANTTPTPTTYCDASGGASTTWISNVSCAATSFTNASTQTQSSRGYTNYTSTPATLYTGANALVLTPGFSSTAATRYWTVWVDFNNDLDFDDAGELLYTNTTGSTSAVTANITIPTTAAGTSRRMRVLMSASSTMAACGIFTTGEVEDYLINFATPPVATVSYCTANSTNATYEWIAGVSTGTFNNTSTQAQSSTGYTNYTSQTITMYLGTNTVRLTPGFSGSAYGEYWGIWIDLNGDNDFADAGEQILGTTTSNTSTVTTTVSIPSTITNTPRRMRVVMSDNASLSYCGSFTYGEVEDYTVVIQRPSSTGPSPAPTGYCTASGNSVVDEWIDYVAFGGITNTTGANGGYGNFTNLTGTLAAGSTSSFSFSAGFSGSAYTEAWAIYIDLNRDGDFADAGELVVSTTSSASTTLSANVTIPSTASVGLTRVRVIMRYKTAPTYCGTFDYGEVEDYLLNITAAGTASLTSNFDDQQIIGEMVENNATGISTFDQSPAVSLYPNPTTSDVTVHFDRFNEDKNYQIFTMDGKMVASGLITNRTSQIATGQLPAGAYLVRFTDRYNTWTEKLIKQ